MRPPTSEMAQNIKIMISSLFDWEHHTPEAIGRQCPSCNIIDRPCHAGQYMAKARQRSVCCRHGNHVGGHRECIVDSQRNTSISAKPGYAWQYRQYFIVERSIEASAEHLGMWWKRRRLGKLLIAVALCEYKPGRWCCHRIDIGARKIRNIIALYKSFERTDHDHVMLIKYPYAVKGFQFSLAFLYESFMK